LIRICMRVGRRRRCKLIRNGGLNGNGGRWWCDFITCVDSIVFDILRSFDPNYGFGRFAGVSTLSFSIPLVSHPSIAARSDSSHTNSRFIVFNSLIVHCLRFLYGKLSFMSSRKDSEFVFQGVVSGGEVGGSTRPFHLNNLQSLYYFWYYLGFHFYGKGFFFLYQGGGIRWAVTRIFGLHGGKRRVASFPLYSESDVDEHGRIDLCIRGVGSHRFLSLGFREGWVLLDYHFGVLFLQVSPKYIRGWFFWLVSLVSYPRFVFIFGCIVYLQEWLHILGRYISCVPST